MDLNKQSKQKETKILSISKANRIHLQRRFTQEQQVNEERSCFLSSCRNVNSGNGSLQIGASQSALHEYFDKPPAFKVD